jgi:hypothetical protein
VEEALLFRIASQWHCEAEEANRCKHATSPQATSLQMLKNNSSMKKT